jgi:hypothetical protein
LDVDFPPLISLNALPVLAHPAIFFRLKAKKKKKETRKIPLSRHASLVKRNFIDFKNVFFLELTRATNTVAFVKIFTITVVFVT